MQVILLSLYWKQAQIVSNQVWFYTLASRVCPSVCWADHEVERFFFCATSLLFLFHFPKALSTRSPADISLLMTYSLSPSNRKC